METPGNEIRRPSRWWLVLAALCAVLAVALALAATMVQRSASEPIGEGDVFVDDASTATGIVANSDDPSVAVSQARNTLEIEAVSLVASDGAITSSTSPSLVGTELENGFLAFSVGEGRFAALATPIKSPIFLDGVRTWDEQTVLYQVVSPLSDGSAVMLHYDISELLSRRARSAGIQPETIELLALTAVFAIIGIAVAIGHMRAVRRYEALVNESKLLRQHTEELAHANVELEEARHEAERALELAEEKIRIRSEFVLMINHELRTPLTSVITGANLLKDDDLAPADRRQLIEAMVDDGTRLQEMIDQILAVARIENKGLSYELGETSLRDLENALASAQGDLEPVEGANSHTNVLTDVSAVSLVVSSLADNARTHGASGVTISFGLERRVDPMVEVGTEPRPAVYVTVRDDGPGIDVAFLPRIFEKFEKSSFSSGTGLGLYMARTIVEALHGSIAVETSAHGTAFEIALPVIGARERVGQL